MITIEQTLLEQIAKQEDENKILREKLEITQAVVDELLFGGVVE